MRVEFPEKLEFFVNPEHPDYAKRNKIIYGGRGGLKSWGVADASVIRGNHHFERILFSRETMDSIKESCHYLLEQRIYTLGLKSAYEIEQQAIYGPSWLRCPVCGHGVKLTARKGISKCPKCLDHELMEAGRTEIIFAGLRHNVRNIKSLEGVTICVVEEAESVSQDSWDTLLPTIRWEDKAAGRASEVWVVFNPKFKKDDTYKRWLVNTPPDSIVVKTSWRDGAALGWFPDVLRKQMEHMKAIDYEGYLHVWEGECVQALKGAIYRNEYAQADKDGRIGQVAYHPGYPVDTYWDLGFGDRNAIWLVQHVQGWHNFIGYIESASRTLSWYVAELQKLPYVWGTDYLPHDGVDAMLHGRLTGDRSKSPDQVLRGLGRKVLVTPKLEVTTGINAARTIFPLCRFDDARCREGLDALQQYQWGPDAASGQERTKPLHDWASHGSDAYRNFGVAVKDEKAPQPKQEQNYSEEYSWQG